MKMCFIIRKFSCNLKFKNKNNLKLGKLVKNNIGEIFFLLLKKFIQSVTNKKKLRNIKNKNK